MIEMAKSRGDRRSLSPQVRNVNEVRPIPIPAPHVVTIVTATRVPDQVLWVIVAQEVRDEKEFVDRVD